MSNPYGPKIETAEDWNDALGCCCEMPLPPEPTMICEHKTVTREAVGWGVQNYRSAYGIGAIFGFDPEDLPCAELHKTYRDVSVTVVFSSTDPAAEGYTTTMTVHVEDGAVYNIFAFPSPSTQVGDTTSGAGVDSYSNGTFTGTATTDYEVDGETYTDTYVTTIVFSSPVTISDVQVQLSSGLAAAPTWTAGGCIAAMSEIYYVCDGEPTEQLASAVATKVRYRWRVPVSHLGTYFKITWDILNEPTGWDDMSIPESARPVAFREKNLSVEWTGPGSGAQSDSSWFAGDWQSLDAPDFVGERRIVNIRYEHMRRAGA